MVVGDKPLLQVARDEERLAIDAVKLVVVLVKELET